MRQLQQLRCLGRYEVWKEERGTFLCGINRFMFMFTSKFTRCNEVGSGEKLKTKKFLPNTQEYIYIYIYIYKIGSAAFEEDKKLLTSAKRHKFTQEKKLK